MRGLWLIEFLDGSRRVERLEVPTMVYPIESLFVAPERQPRSPTTGSPCLPPSWRRLESLIEHECHEHDLEYPAKDRGEACRTDLRVGLAMSRVV